MSNIKIIQAISYICNCRCDYCMNNGLNFSKKEVPVEDLILFYDKLFTKESNNLNVDFTITGGEPFHPNVKARTVKLLEYLCNLECIHKVRINTNGYYELPSICKNKKVLIQFSLDGHKEYADKIAHKKGLFDNVIKNIDFCKDNNINYQTRTVVTDENLKDIDFIAELANKYKHKAFIQTGKPVGGLDQKSESNEIFRNILRTEKLKKRYKNIPYVKIVDIVYTCKYFNLQNKDDFAILVNPSGELGGCAFLANKFMSKYNIYNFFSIGLRKYKQIASFHIRDGTCSIPNGIKNFEYHLSENNKMILEKEVGHKIV